VRAAAGGRVTHVGVIAGRSTITVTHRSGVRTTYEPVVPAVAPGQVVPAGAVLGAVAAAGSHCGGPSQVKATCLHFGALRGRTYLDPLALLRGGPVVLLPMR
jgi:murein DD-endopeptidase MepM/ murein hydrolase activator NlpD